MTVQKIKSILNVFGMKPETILKAFGKVAPKYASFLGNASAAGYGSNEILNFLKSKFSSKNEKEAEDHAQLERRKEGGNARADERAASTLQTQRSDSRDLLSKGASAIGNIGAAALGGAAIPAAMQGINSFLGQREDQQQPQQDQAQPTQQAQPINKAPSNGQATPTGQPNHNPASSFISQFPELAKYIESEIAKGASPQEAASTARARKLLRPIIDKIESGIGEKFEDLISRLYPGKVKETSGSSNQKNESEDLGAALRDLISMIKGK